MTNSDVKRFESQRLTDEEDGGGRVTGNSRTISKTMKLTLPDNRQFFVIFDRSNGDPVEAQQLMPFAYPEDSDQYLLTLRLLTVH